MRFFFSFFIFISFFSSFGQSFHVPTSYHYFVSEINPAYAGSRDGLSISHLYKNHWAQFKGAPYLIDLGIHSPIYKSILGLGVNYSLERIGPNFYHSIYGDISGTIPITKDKKHDLRIGVKSGADWYRNRLTTITTSPYYDPSFHISSRKVVKPNFGFGLIYENDNFYIGYSIPKLLQSPINFTQVNGQSSLPNSNRFHYLMVGAFFPLDKNNKVIIKPLILNEISEGIFNNKRILLNFEFFRRFWLGTGFGTIFNFTRQKNQFRLNELNFLAGIRIGKIAELAYTFNYYPSVNKSFIYNSASHEFNFRIDIIYNWKRDIEKERWF